MLKYVGVFCLAVTWLVFALTAASARDAASGLPTGKRMHKPIVLTKETDKASPKFMNNSAGKSITKQTDQASPKLMERHK